MVKSPTSAKLLSVNLAVRATTRSRSCKQTGIDKRPIDGAVEVQSTGNRRAWPGSGLVGDFIGDRRSHGGDDQAVYAYAFDDFRWWADEVGVTASGGAVRREPDNRRRRRQRRPDRRALGDRKRGRAASDGPSNPLCHIPRVDESSGLAQDLRRGRSAGGLSEGRAPGRIIEGDSVRVTHKPTHTVTIAMVFRALTTEPDSLASAACGP